jgi:hypothetical protein
MTQRVWFQDRTNAAAMLGALAFALAVVFFCPASLWADEFESGAVQIRLIPGAAISTINLSYGTTTIDSLPPMYILSLPPGISEEEMLAQMAADPSVFEAEMAWKSETPEGVRQMVVAAVGGTIEDYLDQGVADRLRLPQAHEQADGSGVVVAVLDTGVMMGHPALSGVIESDGWDFVDNDPDPTDAAGGIDEDLDGLTDEAAGHGTMVAGIIHLVAPGATILPIRVLNDEGIGRSFDVAKGIRYAVEHGAQVINMSLGMLTHTFVITNEVAGADTMSVSLVSGAGNIALENPAYFPGSDWRVFCVAALDSNDVKAEFSNWNLHLEMSAPGVGIMAPYYDGGYAVGAGTSFAAPFIAGQIALIRSLRPDLSPDEIRTVVGQGVVDIYSIPGNEPYLGALGAGRFDGIETLAAAVTVGVPMPIPSERGRIWISPNPVPLGQSVLIRITAGVVNGTGAIFDPQGRAVRSLQCPASGGSAYMWDGLDEAGRPVPSGVYFVRVGGPEHRLFGRIVIPK